MRLSHNIAIHELIPRQISAALPQARKVYCFVLNDRDALDYYSSSPEDIFRSIKRIKTFLRSANSGWYSRNETPLGEEKQMGQIKLEGELEKDHLFLRDIPVKEGNLYLLIRFSPFVISTQNYLNASEKKVLEICVRGMSQQYIEVLNRDTFLLKNIAKSSEMLQQELIEVRDKLEARNMHFENILNQLLNLIVSRLENSMGIRISYSLGFIKTLMDYSGSWNELEKYLAEQVAMEGNISLLNGREHLQLNETHLLNLISHNKKIPVEQDINMQLGPYAKGYQLLDRYESAALLAQKAGKSIIGKSIGEFCSPPVSNASITDALNKHSRKIYELFKRYPERWPLLRNEFRSVSNIIEKESIRRQAV